MNRADFRPAELPAQPEADAPINWVQMVPVLIIIGLGFGIAGNSDYIAALEGERADLRQEVTRLRAEVEYQRSVQGVACVDGDAGIAHMEVR